MPRKDRPARRWILAVVVFIGRDIAGLQTVGFDIAQNSRPKLDAVSKSEGVRMGRALVWAREDMQASEDHFRPSGTIPIRQFVSSPRKRKMHRDAHNLRHGTKWWTAVEQIFVPIFNPPMRRRGRGKAGQR